MPQYTLPHQKAECITYIENSDEKLVVSIDKPKRSVQQNRTYWSNINILAKYSGHTDDEMSAIVKNGITKKGTLKMLYYIQAKGDNVPVETSTADLNTKDFGILMDYVFQIGNALGLVMNDPNIVEYAEELFSKS